MKTKKIWKTKELSGPLAEPIKMDLDARLDMAAEWLSKLSLLCDHYDIPEDKRDGSHWCTLAMLLASDFVPGFQFKAAETRGRKSHSPVTLIRMIVDIQRVRDEKNCGVSEAAKILTTSSRFAEAWGDWKKENLENVYHKAIKDKRVHLVVSHINKQKATTEKE